MSFIKTLILVSVSALLTNLIVSTDAAFFSKWLMSSINAHHNPGSQWQCPTLPPDMTYCSQLNPSNQLVSPESLQEVNVWIALLRSNCHPQSMKFVCTVYNPVCLHSHRAVPILPCREFCIEVRDACLSRMYLFGFNWPQQVDCSRFPSKDTSMCVSSKHESVICTPCNQQISRQNIVRKYCQADIVVKSQIAGVTAFGNSSNLLITLNRVSETLFPQTQINISDSPKPNPLSTREDRKYGFMDTNYDILNHVQPLRSASDRSKMVIKNDILTQQQADQSNQITISPTKLLRNIEIAEPTTAHNDYEIAKNGRRKLKQAGLGRLRLHGRKRDRRASFIHMSIPAVNLMSPKMLLQCAGCSLQLPTSAMAPNSATRWLIMASDNSTPTSHVMQIIALMPWQRDSLEFNKALRDIRNIPRAILCHSGTKMELNTDGFGWNMEPERNTSHHRQPTYPPGWSKQLRNSYNRSWALSAPAFEGLFQNDAAVSHSNRKKVKQKKGKRWNRQNMRRGGVQRIENNLMTLNKMEKLRRRKARKERLSNMSVKEKEAWMARKQARRAERLKIPHKNQ